MSKPIVVILIMGALVSGALFYHPSSNLSQDKIDQKEIKIIFVGDIMLSRAVGKIIEREGVTFPFSLVASTTRNADIVFGNLENPVSYRGENVGSIYSFRADPKVIAGLVFAGFDVLSLANNHIFDWGEDALLDTVEFVRSAGMVPVGVGGSLIEARAPGVIERGDKTVCFYGYSQFADSRGGNESRPAVAPLNSELIAQDINNGKNYGCKVIIISVHWGNEYETTATREQRELAHKIIDAGATIVVGHHPHVLQEIEEYGGGLIAYSLGNFIFDQNFSVDTKRSAMLEVTFSSGGDMTYKIIPIRFTDLFVPYMYTDSDV
jgi:poly-gamma-glutamate capsule biosynthesis protein CapA/YwtB (metallophosphatase superfamily)